MPRQTSPKNRRWWDTGSRASNDALREEGRVGHGRQQSSSPTRSRLSLTGILSQTNVIKEVSLNPKQITIFQVLILTVTTAAVGTLIAKLVPEAALNTASNGVYIAGLVLILLIETIYQWGLRATILATEDGFSAYVQIESPGTDVAGLRSELEKRREPNEDRLRRTLEPVERVSLLAIGIMTHLIALESIEGNHTPPWAATLANDWAITLLLGLAGLLWQLKNQYNISKLTSETWVERLLILIGNRLLVIIIPIQALASVGILSVAYYPWGILSGLPLLLVAIWYFKKLVGDPRMSVSERPDQKRR